MRKQWHTHLQGQFTTESGALTISIFISLILFFYNFFYFRRITMGPITSKYYCTRYHGTRPHIDLRYVYKLVSCSLYLYLCAIFPLFLYPQTREYNLIFCNWRPISKLSDVYVSVLQQFKENCTHDLAALIVTTASSLFSVLLLLAFIFSNDQT